MNGRFVTTSEGRLELSVDGDGERRIVRLSGELDADTAGRLRQLLVELLAGGVQHIVLDLDDVAFVDSAGLGALVGGLKRARERGGDVSLAAPRPAVAKVLDVTGLDRVFQVVPELPAVG